MALRGIQEYIARVEDESKTSNIARAILKKYCPPHKARGIHDFILATKSSVWIIIIIIIHTELLVAKIKSSIPRTL